MHATVFCDCLEGQPLHTRKCDPEDAGIPDECDSAAIVSDLNYLLPGTGSTCIFELEV